MSVTIHGPGDVPGGGAQQPNGAQQAVPRPARPGQPPLDYVTDSLGRRLGVRHIGPVERMRIFKACGPTNSKIQEYVGSATLAYAVAEIDGETLTPPINELQLEAIVSRLGEEGIDAAAMVMMRRQGITEADIEASGGNISEAVRIAAERRQQEVLASAKNSQERQS